MSRGAQPLIASCQIGHCLWSGRSSWDELRTDWPRCAWQAGESGREGALREPVGASRTITAGASSLMRDQTRSPQHHDELLAAGGRIWSEASRGRRLRGHCQRVGSILAPARQMPTGRRPGDATRAASSVAPRRCLGPLARSRLSSVADGRTACRTHWPAFNYSAWRTADVGGRRHRGRGPTGASQFIKRPTRPRPAGVCAKWT